MVKCDRGSENPGGSEKELEERRLWSGVDMGTVCVFLNSPALKVITYSWAGPGGRLEIGMSSGSSQMSLLL